MGDGATQRRTPRVQITRVRECDAGLRLDQQRAVEAQERTGSARNGATGHECRANDRTERRNIQDLAGWDRIRCRHSRPRAFDGHWPAITGAGARRFAVLGKHREHRRAARPFAPVAGGGAEFRRRGRIDPPVPVVVGFDEAAMPVHRAATANVHPQHDECGDDAAEWTVVEQESGRRDSNSQHSGWKPDTLPLSYARGCGDGSGGPRRRHGAGCTGNPEQPSGGMTVDGCRRFVPSAEVR